MHALPWLSLFLLLFASGSLLWVCVIPLGRIGSRFHRIAVYIAFFLGLCAYLSSGADRAHLPLGILAAITFVYSAVAGVPGFRWYVPLNVVVGGAGLAYALSTVPSLTPWSAAAEVGLALVVGGSLQTMLLGHSYLNMANLSFGLLVSGSRLLCIAAVARALASVVAVAIAGDVVGWFHRDALLGLFLVVRYLVGIVGVFALSWMAMACAKIRANQSATGILYVVLAFAVIGEATACYLWFREGVYL